MIRLFVVAIVCFIMGWVSCSIGRDVRELTCNDFNTKHSVWKGFMSTKNGEMRCFWLEQSYPNRVKQGVPVNE